MIIIIIVIGIFGKKLQEKCNYTLNEKQLQQYCSDDKCIFSNFNFTLNYTCINIILNSEIQINISKQTQQYYNHNCQYYIQTSKSISINNTQLQFQDYAKFQIKAKQINISSSFIHQNIILSNQKYPQFLIINTQKIYINKSTVISQKNICNYDCTCIQSNQNCNSTKPYNFISPIPKQSDILINSTNFYLISSNITGSTVIINSSNLFSLQNSNIITIGCPTNYGQGCGVYFNIQDCGGTGGSHDGLGAYNKIKQKSCSQIQGRGVYQGGTGSSGGGLQGGAGGGVIFILTQHYSQYNSNLTANGLPGNLNSGGGSGGSIYIKIKHLNDLNGNIVAQGGQSMGQGGYGGGGQIYLFFIEWNKDQIKQTYNFLQKKKKNFNISVSGGYKKKNQSLTIHQIISNGKIIISPCLPNYYQNQIICKNCSNGTYKYSIGNNICIKCPDLPQNLQYINECNYTCSKEYQNVSGQCLNQVDLNLLQLYH